MYHSEIDVVQILSSVGVPFGKVFEFALGEGKLSLELAHLGIAFRFLGCEGSGMTVFQVWVVWLLSAFARANGLGAFSWPMSDGEYLQVLEFAKKFGSPLYRTMEIDELILRVQTDMRAFWQGFLPRILEGGRVQ
jgi:hypothetical protein